MDYLKISFKRCLILRQNGGLLFGSQSVLRMKTEPTLNISKQLGAVEKEPGSSVDCMNSIRTTGSVTVKQSNYCFN